ncbi:MAG: tetratricopeptide repeat protein, partial [Oscillospiraceae bacterium]|nr:tetratricopeptide repeat protein [Oscillospiraceae bacterium]
PQRGPPPPAGALVQYTHGSLLGIREVYVGSEQALQQAHRILVQQYGPNDPRMLEVYNGLAVVSEKLGRDQETREYAARINRIYKAEYEKQKAAAEQTAKDAPSGGQDSGGNA